MSKRKTKNSLHFFSDIYVGNQRQQEDMFSWLQLGIKLGLESSFTLTAVSRLEKRWKFRHVCVRLLNLQGSVKTLLIRVIFSQWSTRQPAATIPYLLRIIEKENKLNVLKFVPQILSTYDGTGLDTSFVTFETRLPQPEIKITRRRHLQNPLQSCFVVLLIFDLLLKTCSWILFTHYLLIFLNYFIVFG